MAEALGEEISMTAPSAPSAGLAAIAERVDARICDLLDREVRRWSDVDPDLAEPFEGLRALVLAGGKRLRPAFCHWAFVGAGGNAADPVITNAGAALELLHTFALIHDDVMDGSSERRGHHTIHQSFDLRHALAGWRGEGRRFGEGVAILVGDLAFVYADLLLGDAPRAAVEVFNELRLEVNVGQYLDLLGAVKGGPTRGSAQRICRYKSGKYTVERPLHLGAALVGRLDELGPFLSAYGLPLGEAFQLRDDLLGAFGDSAITGKPVGDDLREGKPTLLYAIAAECTDSRSLALLERLGAPDLGDDEISSLQRLLVDTGACEEVERAVDRLMTEALQALELAPITVEAKGALADLARYVAGRDR